MVGIAQKNEKYQLGSGQEQGYETVYRVPMVRGVSLGALYNIYRELVYIKENVWTTEQWNECSNEDKTKFQCIRKDESKEDKLSYQITESTEDRLNIFQVDAEAKLSIKFKLVDVSGSLMGQYADTSTHNLDETRFSFVKKTTVYTKYIRQNPAEVSDEHITNMLDRGYTHYVSSITCTTFIMLDFVKIIKQGKDRNFMKGELAVQVKALKFVDVDGKLSISKESNSTNHFEDLNVKYYGSVPYERISGSLEDVLENLNENILPKASKDESCDDSQMALIPITSLYKNVIQLYIRVSVVLS